MTRVLSVLATALALVWATSATPQLPDSLTRRAQQVSGIVRGPQISLCGAVNHSYVVFGVTAGVIAVAGIGMLVSFAYMSPGDGDSL